MAIYLRPLGTEDIAFLKKWLNEPHVASVWKEDTSEEKLAQKYISSSDDFAVKMIIEMDSRPIGYFQYYWASKVGHGWWENADDHTVGIDLYLGESDLLGQGVGFKIVSYAVQFLFKNPRVQKIIADPSPTNLRMIHLLDKAGFRSAGNQQTPDGVATVMEIYRS